MARVVVAAVVLQDPHVVARRVIARGVDRPRGLRPRRRADPDDQLARVHPILRVERVAEVEHRRLVPALVVAAAELRPRHDRWIRRRTLARRQHHHRRERVRPGRARSGTSASSTHEHPPMVGGPLPASGTIPPASGDRPAVGAGAGPAAPPARPPAPGAVRSGRRCARGVYNGPNPGRGTSGALRIHPIVPLRIHAPGSAARRGRYPSPGRRSSG